MSTSADLFLNAQRVTPGGVHSPVRSFRSVGGIPPFIQRASGAYLEDVEGKRYVDYIGSYGPAILGHGHPDVVNAVQQAASRGLSFGTPHPQASELCETIIDMMPHLEQVRLVNSGTEACMTALRLARAITGRQAMLKFIGGYHGHEDSFLVSAGSGATTLGTPSSPGVPESTSAHTLLAPYNDIHALEAIFTEHGDTLAAVFVEPVAGNMGLVLPKPGFLETLRRLCDQHQTLLIFDEVMTGFRVHPSGACRLFGVTPDLTTLGKIIGGGLPVGAVAGPKALMEALAPAGPVYQAGTLSGNPLSVAAGLATLKHLQAHPHVFKHIREHTQTLCQAIQALAADHNIPIQTPHIGGMFALYFHDRPVQNYDDATQTHQTRFQTCFHSWLEQGIHFAPSSYEAAFVSFAHDETTHRLTLAAMETSFQRLH